MKSRSLALLDDRDDFRLPIFDGSVAQSPNRPITQSPDGSITRSPNGPTSQSCNRPQGRGKPRASSHFIIQTSYFSPASRLPPTTYRLPSSCLPSTTYHLPPTVYRLHASRLPLTTYRLRSSVSCLLASSFGSSLVTVLLFPFPRLSGTRYPEPALESLAPPLLLC
jgi:hypothetical protein